MSDTVNLNPEQAPVQSHDQEDIDAAIAAMQLEASGEEQSAESAVPEADDDKSVASAEVSGQPAVDAVGSLEEGHGEMDVSTEGIDPEEIANREGSDGRLRLEDFSGLDGEDEELAAAIADDAPATEAAPTETPAAAANEVSPMPESLSLRKPDFAGQPSERGSALGRRKLRFGLLLLCAGALMAAAGFYGRELYSKVAGGSQEEALPVAEAPGTPVIPEKPPAPEPAAAIDPYDAKLNEIDRLRSELLVKKDEIDRLKQFYRDGISELEEELIQVVTRLGTLDFGQAMGHREIELDVRAIQRRWAYIDALEQPLHWLHQGSEELLFLSRRTRIDLQMQAVASGIELTRHLRHMDAALQKYRLAPERLAIDPAGRPLRPLEQIWKEVAAKATDIARDGLTGVDQAISEEICNDGNTARIADLTTLTIRVAKCLAQVDTSELFLNRLSALSPVAAKYLAGWKGNWLCLNGFRRLTPEVARHLFNWQGNWLSLNGLESFPPEIGEMLLAWDGRQLELMGLVYDPERPQLIALQQLARWEKAGGKLFVSNSVRTELDNFH